MYLLTIDQFNYPVVFGCMFGFLMLIVLESMVSEAVIFVKGVR